MIKILKFTILIFYSSLLFSCGFSPMYKNIETYNKMRNKQFELAKKYLLMLKNANKYLEIFKDHKYIFNLGHGVMPETKPDNVKILVDFVKNFK